MNDTIVKEAQHIYFKGRHNGLSVITYTNHPACCLQGCDIETRRFSESQSASFITLGFQERKIVPPDVAYVARNRNDALLKTIVKTLRLAHKKCLGCPRKQHKLQLRQKSCFGKVRLQNTPPGNKRLLSTVPGTLTNYFRRRHIYRYFKHT